MLTSCFAGAQALTTAVLRRWLLLGLVLGSLGACQRASYQFQPIASAAYQIEAPLPGPECAVVAVATPPAVRLDERYQRAGRSARRPSGLPRAVRPLLPSLPRPRAVRTLASVATPAHIRLHRQDPEPAAKPLHHRSRTIAILLAVLSLTYFPLSLHNFYLGYYSRGALAIALVIVGGSLTVLGLFAGLFTSGGVGFVGAFGLVMLAGWFIWQVSDLIRIITGDLQPKDGSYDKPGA